MIIDIFKATFSGPVYYRIFSALVMITILTWIVITYRVYVNEQEKKYLEARPKLSIGSRYEKEGNIFVLSIKTQGGGHEIIEHMTVKFSVKGLVKNIKQGFSLGPSLTVKPKISNGLISGDKPIYHSVWLDYEDIKPGVLHNVLVDFQKSKANVRPDDRIAVEWYWKYKGETQVEDKFLNKKYVNKNFDYEDL